MTQDPRQEQKTDQNRDPAQAVNTQPGVMGDGTEEQNLGQPGNPEARIKEDEVQDAFGQKQQNPQDQPRK